MKNRDKFIGQFRTMHSASIGLSVVRTGEAFRAQDTLLGIAYDLRMPFKVWSMIDGWHTYEMANPDKAPTKDGTREIMAAMSLICGHNSSQATTGFPDGIYAVMWPHFIVKNIPPLLQMFAEIARKCAETHKRVVLIVPPSFVVPPELRESVSVLDFDLPNREEMVESYARICESIPDPQTRPRYQQAEVDKILSALLGMTEMEAESALARAVAEYRSRLPNVPLDEFLKTVLDVKTEVVKRSDVLEVMTPDSMNSIGGLGALKEWVRNRKRAFTPEARRAGVDQPKGMLLVGPPGTGKSLAAKATSSELGLPLIRFDMSRIYAGIVGESEGRAREALKTLDAMAPAVVLVDEVDKATGVSSGTNDGGVSSRILGIVLTHLQESQAGLFWIMTANRTQNLPSELVRKGRIDEIFAVSLPNEEERMETLRIHLRKRKTDPDTVPNLDGAVLRSAGYVNAEIEAAVAEAKLLSFSQDIPLTGDLILRQFENTKPLSEAFKADFDAMRVWADNNARPASSAPQAIAAQSVSPVGTVPRVRRRGMVDVSTDN